MGGKRASINIRCFHNPLVIGVGQEIASECFVHPPSRNCPFCQYFKIHWEFPKPERFRTIISGKYVVEDLCVVLARSQAVECEAKRIVVPRMTIHACV